MRTLFWIAVGIYYAVVFARHFHSIRKTSAQKRAESRYWKFCF